MNILQKEKEKGKEKFEYKKVSSLKSTIKSNALKNMLIAEDLEYKNKQFNDIKIKPKNEKKILKQKKEKHKEDIKIKKETIEKKDKGNMTSKIPINKIKP